MREKIKIGKRGQFKIQQMAFMLIAVFLFFVMVGLLYLMLQYRNLNEQASILGQNQATLVAESISDYPEFACKKSYCIDSDKLMVFNMDDYKNFFPVEYIRVRKIPYTSEVKCTLSNYPNCNYFDVYESRKIGNVGLSSSGSFVSLCRWEKINGYAQRICELGRISIGYKSY